MEMGPSGFLLKTLVTTHLDIRSYSSHAPSQGIKTNANTNTKSNTKAKTKTSAKKCKNATTLNWIFLQRGCKLPFNQPKTVAKSLQFIKWWCKRQEDKTWFPMIKINPRNKLSYHNNTSLPYDGQLITDVSWWLRLTSGTTSTQFCLKVLSTDEFSLLMKKEVSNVNNIKPRSAFLPSNLLKTTERLGSFLPTWSLNLRLFLWRHPFIS